MDTLRLLSRGSGVKLARDFSNHSQTIPSAGGKGNLQNETSKKRKRDDVDVKGNTRKVLIEPEIRKLQKQHKIRITDLRALHDDQNSESRKAQKEGSRLFPQMLESFSHLSHYDVTRGLLANIAKQGYKEPTEVQLATIPLLLESDSKEPDLLTIAPTGSGKTLAFLIPLINKIIRSHHANSSDSARQVTAIILAPTKELVSQIVNEGRKLCMNTGVKITAMRKGMRLHEDSVMADASSEDDSETETSPAAVVVKSDILVSTPLSLVHSLTDKSTSNTLPLPGVTSLILDEADVLLDTLFREQTMSIWSACVCQDLRTSLWSATIGSNIEELAITTITDRQQEQDISPVPPLIRTIIGLKDTSLPNINHRLIYASTEPGKLMGLRQLLHPPPSHSTDTTTNTPSLRPPFLIFTQTIDRATALHSELQYDIPAASGGSSRIAVLHSALSSRARAVIMTSFRAGKIWILITTDLLSRGVDFRGINGVVNYDIPTTAASYVHRAGRTGRAGRAGGTCVTFYTRDDVAYLKPIANVINASAKNHGNGGSGGGNQTETFITTEAEKEAGLTRRDRPPSFLPDWLIPSLPALTKASRQRLKRRGVEVRRAIRDGEDKASKKLKNQNRIGTRSGYERRLEDKKRGMKEGSRRRKERDDAEVENGGEDGDVFDGFD